MKIKIIKQKQIF